MTALGLSQCSEASGSSCSRPRSSAPSSPCGSGAPHPPPPGNFWNRPSSSTRWWRTPERFEGRRVRARGSLRSRTHGVDHRCARRDRVRGARVWTPLHSSTRASDWSCGSSAAGFRRTRSSNSATAMRRAPRAWSTAGSAPPSSARCRPSRSALPDAGHQPASVPGSAGGFFRPASSPRGRPRGWQRDRIAPGTHRSRTRRRKAMAGAPRQCDTAPFWPRCVRDPRVDLAGDGGLRPSRANGEPGGV